LAASPILAAAQTYAVQRSMSALLPKADINCVLRLPRQLWLSFCAHVLVEEPSSASRLRVTGVHPSASCARQLCDIAPKDNTAVS
jgi:hypothetical protein